MHELRKKLYNEDEKLTSEELDILNFETDFNRTYDAIYWNSALDNLSFVNLAAAIPQGSTL